MYFKNLKRYIKYKFINIYKKETIYIYINKKETIYIKLNL